MKIRILKGTNQIGGVFTEISTSKGTKIIVDFGDDLDGVKRLEHIEGLTTGEPSYKGVFITHNHQDHMGRIDEVLPGVDVYMSDLSREIFERVYCFSKTKGKINRKTIDIQDRKPITIDDITVTPYTVDHSAYNSFMILIEADGKKILHTGDFRNHGYKGKLLIPTLKEIGKIDVLITEGTCLSREQIKNKTELELVDIIAEKTAKYKQVLMLMSTTNIDRVTTMQKVANKTKRTVIHDIVLSNVLELVTQKIPNALNSENVYVFQPTYYYNKRNVPEFKPYIEKYQEKIDKSSGALFKKNIMNIRTTMLADIVRLKTDNNAFDNACVVYSMWSGYKEKEQYSEFIARMKELGIEVIDLHVSGHADYTAIEKMLKYTAPSAVIPIHTEDKEKIKAYTQKAVILEDMVDVYEIK